MIDVKNGYKTVQTLTTEKGARTMAYDASSDRIYLSDADFGPKPAATAANPRPRAQAQPDTFNIIVVGR